MAAPSLVDLYAPFVPDLLLSRFAADPNPVAAPEAHCFPAAALFADVSGFTALTERLAGRGPQGVEELTELLNDYFGRLVAVVDVHGGDVVKFAGDAILAIWAANDARPDEAAARAAACGLALLDALSESPTADQARLTLRIGIGVGEAVALHAGGQYGRWELLVGGPPVVQAGAAEKAARPGEVVLSAEAAELLDRCVDGERLPTGALRIAALRGAPAPGRNEPVAVSPAAEAALRSYVPGAIRARLAAGQAAWLAELRRVTVVFVGVPDLDHAAPDALERTHAVMLAVQAVVYRYEGSILRLGVDDKGTTLMAVYGLPPLAHEDDAARGVLAALAIQGALAELGLRPSIGVTTGRVYCGEVGGARRREYTLLGGPANLAARLMEAADGAVLCDAATETAAHARVTCEPLGAVTVRGRGEPVLVFRPTGAVRRAPTEATAIIGRADERAILAERLDRVGAGRPGGAVVIEGEPGIGKSRLLTDLIARAAQEGVRHLVGAADAVEKSTPYFAWRQVFAALFDVESAPNEPAARARHVIARVPPELAAQAPLLAALLPVELPDTPETIALTGQDRADSTVDLLLTLLTHAAGETAALRLLVLDDAHWLDSASWALAAAVAERLPRIMLVVATRPLTGAEPAERRRLLNTQDAAHLRLEGLPADDVLTLVCQRLGTDRLPEPVAEMIRGRGQGNPFFSEEMALALRDAGLIAVRDRACVVNPAAGDLRAIGFPDTVQGVIADRIDRLSPAEKIAIKAASVVGRVFAYRLLHDVHPLDGDREYLRGHLDALAKLDLTPVDAPEPELAYIFKHVITQEVAYGLLLYAQRRQLHRAVAEWLERAYADELEPHYALLAHHWSRAEEAAKTAYYLDQAGRQALKGGGFREAVGFFTDLLALNTSPDARQRGVWERLLGEAHYGLGERRPTIEHLERALALLGRPVPATTFGRLSQLVAALLRQAVRRRWPAQPSSTASEPALEAVCAYERLFSLYFFDNQVVAAVLSGLRGLNLAESLPPTPELAMLYGDMCYAVGSVPLHGVAETYARLVRETSIRVQDLEPVARAFAAVGWYGIGAAKWPGARVAIDEAVRRSNPLGQSRLRDELLVIRAFGHRQGQFAEAAAAWAEVYERGAKRGDPQVQILSLMGQVENALPRGLLGEAVDLLDKAARLVDGETTKPEVIRFHGDTARVRLRQCDTVGARSAAEAGLRLAATTAIPVQQSLDGYTGVAEVYLALREAGEWVDDRDVRRACELLTAFARPFRLARPRALLCRGLHEWLAGKTARAHRTWAASLASARELTMPYDEARAHYEIGRHTPASDPTRGEHLARATALFESFDAAQDSELTRAALFA